MREKKRKPTHPGMILKCHYLEPLNLSITELSETLGVSRKTISSIVNERASITPDLALRLSRAFQTTPELWLNLQQVYNLWVSVHQNNEWKRVPVLKLQILNAAV